MQELAILRVTCPAGEPTAPFGDVKRATAILNRRVKQSIGEWYVLNLLEQSWDGTAEHTEQGWNIGKACYGYRAERVPHPVPAKRAEGRTKSRLVPHPVEGSTVTRIFHLRYVYRLGYGVIADVLNADLEAHPPPTPVNPERAHGRWSGSAVRGVLTNPKYTGYMVWNRRATSSARGKHNPPEQWVWSPRPTHEPLVTKEVFAAVTVMARARQGSRADRLPRSTLAEAAFVVRDDHQRQGIGPLLLAHLADHARREGITDLVAETLPENASILRLLRRFSSAATAATTTASSTSLCP